MTQTLTTEQLRARAAHLRAKAEQWRDQGYAGKAARLDGDADALDELAANREAQPVAVMYKDGSVLTKEECGNVFDICCKVETPLFTAPPAPAVPEEITSANAPEVFEMAAIVERLGLRGAYGAYAAGFNACRAAMLQSVPGTQTAPALDLDSKNEEVTPGPAPAVPDERAAFNAWNNEDNLPIAGIPAKNAAWLAWQARAMLVQPVSQGYKLPPHVFRELVNSLRDTAVKYQGTQQLREQLSRTLKENGLSAAAPEGGK